MVDASRAAHIRSRRFPDFGHTVSDRAKGPFLKRLEDYLRAQAAAGRLIIDNVETASNQFLAVITGHPSRSRLCPSPDI
jgi:hypothetical protein